MHAMLMK